MRITKLYFTLFLTLLLTLAWGVSHAQITPKHLPFKAVTEGYQINDENILVTVTLDMEPEWYTYADDPGGMGKPTRLSGFLANGTTPIIAIYPKGKQKPDLFDPSVMVNTFPSGTRIYTVIPNNGQSLPLKLQLELLLCHPTKCIPVRMEFTFGETLDITTLPQANEQPWWKEFTTLAQAKVEKLKTQKPPQTAQPTAEGYIKWTFSPRYLQPQLEVTSLLSAIFMGLLAGLILNIMPCVLPVVSIKLTALLNSGTVNNREERIHAFREHNTFFALGILTFFLVLAVVLGITGQAWGALFQNQWLVLGIAALIFTLSLSLFGLFHLPIVDLKFGRETKNPRIQAFFTGNLTTLLATPCSGPFLGGVLGWALLQGPLIIALVFISIGIGMASPYLLMIAWPDLSKHLPRSGPWIEYVEKGIAFFLVGTACYLVSIAFGQEILRILAPLWALVLGAWVWYRSRPATLKTKLFICTCAVGLLALMILWTTPTPVAEDPWEPFNPVELSQRIGKEKIFLDFTADWCPTCKVLEATVLTSENMLRWKKKYGLTLIKIDMTERDPEAEALLQALGSMSIPTAALILPGDQSSSPLVLRDLFTESQLENVLESWEK